MSPPPDEKKPPTGYATVRGEERPPLPATVQTEKAPAWAISMQERIVAKQDANHGIVMNEMGRLSARIDDLESWRKTGQNRSYSGPIQSLASKVESTSQNDQKQDGVIAQILVKQAEMATKVDSLVTSQTTQTAMLATLSKRAPELFGAVVTFWTDPRVKTAREAIVSAVVGYAVLKGWISK